MGRFNPARRGPRTLPIRQTRENQPLSQSTSVNLRRSKMAKTTCDKVGCENPIRGAGITINRNCTLEEFAFCSSHLTQVGMDYIIPDPSNADVGTRTRTYEECRLHRIVFL